MENDDMEETGAGMAGMGTAAVVVVDDGTLDRAEMKAQAKPNSYEAQLEYVACLVSATKSNPEVRMRLRQACEAVSQKWPMGEVTWIEWLEAEIGATDFEDAEAAKYVVDLCRRSTQDYISVDLWLAYCDVVAQCNAAAAEEERIRAAFEEAVASPSAYGILDGIGIWEAYCEFERNLQNSANVLKLYRRMFETPLNGMDRALASMDVWCKDNGVPQEEIDAVKAVYKATHDLYEAEIVPRETGLSTEEEGSWVEYAKFLEERKAKFLCVCSVYERGIKEMPQSPELWKQYIAYVERCVLEKYDPANSTNNYLATVYRRATRNCRDCGAVWAGYIRLVEQSGDPTVTVPGLVYQANCCISTAEEYEEVLHAYISACRRLVDPSTIVGSEPSASVEAFRDVCKYAVKSLEGKKTAKHPFKKHHFKKILSSHSFL